MIEAEADALKILSKTTEVSEALMPTETIEGALKMVVEAPKKLKTAAGELNLMDLESGATTAVKASAEGGGATLSSHIQWQM